MFINLSALSLKGLWFDLNLILLIANNGKVPKTIRHGRRFTLLGLHLDIGHRVFVLSSQYPMYHAGLRNG